MCCLNREMSNPPAYFSNVYRVVSLTFPQRCQNNHALTGHSNDHKPQCCRISKSIALFIPITGLTFCHLISDLNLLPSVATIQPAPGFDAVANIRLIPVRGRNPVPPLCHWGNTVSPGASRPFPQRSPASLA